MPLFGRSGSIIPGAQQKKNRRNKKENINPGTWDTRGVLESTELSAIQCKPLESDRSSEALKYGTGRNREDCSDSRCSQEILPVKTHNVHSKMVKKTDAR